MPRLGGLAVISGFLISAVYLVISMYIERKIDFAQENLTKCNKLNRWTRWLIIWNSINILYITINNICTK